MRKNVNIASKNHAKSYKTVTKNIHITICVYNHLISIFWLVCENNLYCPCVYGHQEMGPLHRYRPVACQKLTSF